VVRHVSDHVGVMYLGRMVELAPKRPVRHAAPPLHAHAAGRHPQDARHRPRAHPVQGEVPNPLNPPSGCTFHPRCPLANARCKSERPKLLSVDGVQVACHAVEEGRA
jgi:peptide/nickel transport system ATP-binding protein